MCFFSDGKRFKASGAGASSMVSESLEYTTKDCTEEEYLQAVKESSASAFAGEMDHHSTFLYLVIVVFPSWRRNSTSCSFNAQMCLMYNSP